MMNRKKRRREQSWLNRAATSEFSWRDKVKQPKASVAISGYPIEVRTKHYTDYESEALLLGQSGRFSCEVGVGWLVGVFLLLPLGAHGIRETLRFTSVS
jgi:hypothetical protein